MTKVFEDAAVKLIGTALRHNVDDPATDSPKFGVVSAAVNLKFLNVSNIFITSSLDL